MIQYIDSQRIFLLHNKWLSVVLCIYSDENKCDELLLTHFGAPLDNPGTTIPRISRRGGASFDTLRQILPYACPTEGRGDYRPPMVSVRDEEGQNCTELFYEGYRIEPGKPRLDGLPASYVEQTDEADTLLITLGDPLTGLKVELSYTLYRERPILAASARYINHGVESFTLEAAGSVCVTLPGRYDMIHLHGAWAKERAVERVPPATMTRMISSVRGASGHEHNPFVVLAAPDATEFDGECLGVALVYSGSFAISVDENAYTSTRLTVGLNPRCFSWCLRPGECFQAPEALCVWSGEGLNGMSQSFHSLLRERVCRGLWRDQTRPILINNWEATYFDFDQEKLMNIARAAAEVGIELFVLDDGWFGKRDNDHCSLGDWVENRRKLPGGLQGLASEINKLGMQFGLWFEPEMVSPDSDLYRAHPDWCLYAKKRRRSIARHQLILDMSRQDVQDYVIEAISRVLRSAPINYVKWDMNRNFMETGTGMDGVRQGEVAHRYMLGLYHVMETITANFPDVLFEGCSGGGGRFDAGMLYYMPQIWTSDDSDAVERLFIQYGTSFCYPISSMGAHVSEIPNHQVGRLTSMQMRGDVALGGNLGYELDLSAQTTEDKEEIKRQVKLVKRIRETTQWGVFTRLLSPFDGNVTAWQFTDEKRVVFCAYRVMARPNPAPIRIRLRNVPDGIYLSENGQEFSSTTLMSVGICPDFPRGDFSSCMIVFEKK